MRARLGWVNRSAASALLVLMLVIPDASDSEAATEEGCVRARAVIEYEEMPRLTIRSESGEKTSHDLAEESVTIGRAPENSICLDDISVSSRHAELMMAGDVWQLRDLGSTNGTLVNGEPVTQVQLRAGDRIRFGKVDAYYEGDAAGDAQPLPQSEEIQARPAEMSARPVDFANASPFGSARKEQDPTRRLIFAAALAALLAFVGSMIAVLMMRAPLL